MRVTFLIRWVVPIVGTGVAITVLFWLYRDLDLDRLVLAVATANTRWLWLLAATILAEQLVRGWKWRQILYDLKPISSGRLFGAILAGYGVGVLIPLGISPVVRSWLVARLEGLRLASVLVTTAIERFIDGIVFALIAAFVAILGRIPGIEGNLRLGIAAAGASSLALFSCLLWVIFRWRHRLGRHDAPISRLVDRVASWGGRRLANLRIAIADGIVWPRSRARQVGVVAASVLMKMIAATHFLWAGLAVGIVLNPLDYLFLLIFAGFALILSRFVRVPGGFVIGAGFALNALGVADEPALAMIMFNYVLSIVLMVGVGLVVLWRSGVTIRSIAGATE